ncbi:MAG: DnaJ domain-containing protein [Chloroflexi bacterium]|nr:DnaJ domain-containing protein [Chloroflexota bacterium]MCY3587297.1 DnaJ domain-containing protein [Chloroflexota bacterium]MCY3686657.1 DnaJ domain-containing protein [Chloroflexota bacterium]MDE2709152.1 DnaJ domain-containing protein [Chloroflexota bacterium]
MLDAYDPNELLGIASGASEDEIRKAFRRKAKTVHPDVSDAPDAAERFKQLKDAHDLLIERINGASLPQAGEDLYRPAKDVSDEEREGILNAFRRRRQAEERRRSRRRSAVKGQARRAQRENDALQEEMARRRAAFEASQREESQREQEERRNAEREQRESAAAEARQRTEETRRRTVEELQRTRRKRESRDRTEREPRNRARRSQPVGDAPLECAWKDCRESDDLAAPLPTALGERRFCRRHYDEYIEFRRARQQRETAASARDR